MNTALKAGFAGALLGFVLAACTVKLDDTLKYTCTADTDCGGGGWKCTATTGKGWCCKPTGEEVCNGKDDDCDGKIDNTGKAEVCNGKDDDCNGKIDEGFDLNTQPANCGSCTTQCKADEECLIGKCTRRTETACNDQIDNDNDSLTDCADPDCLGLFCTDVPLYFTCAPGGVCNCNGGPQVQESSRAVCSDGIDNDCDGMKDCGDPHCDLKGCTANSNTDCVCKNGVKTEGNCGNLADDDGDGKTDCADSDCAPGTACTKAAGGAGTCQASTCQ